MENRLSPSSIGVIYDCLHRAKRMADVEYIDTQDADDLEYLKGMANDLLDTLQRIEVRVENDG